MGDQVLLEVYFDGLTKFGIWGSNFKGGGIENSLSNLSQLNTMNILSDTIKPESVRKTRCYLINLMGGNSLKPLVREINDEVKGQVESLSMLDITICTWVNAIAHWGQA